MKLWKSMLARLLPLVLLGLAGNLNRLHGQCNPSQWPGGINRWPQGVVRYVFADSYPQAGKAAVRSAMRQWMDSGAAVVFVEYTGTPLSPYLRIEYSTDGNSACVGPQNPTVGNFRIEQVGAESHIVHELGHALGYPHEQCRPDRDAYVTVHRDRISSDRYDPDFGIVPAEKWPPGALRQPYDYDSIMHYDWCLGSKVGCANGVQGQTDTMTAGDSDYQYTMGAWIGDEGEGLSDGDIMRTRYVYGTAIWVDAASGCSFENGTRACSDTFDFSGPYTTIEGAVDAAPNSADPTTTLMMKAGTYTRPGSGTYRISKAMKLVGYAGTVRIQ